MTPKSKQDLRVHIYFCQLLGTRYWAVKEYITLSVETMTVFAILNSLKQVEKVFTSALRTKPFEDQTKFSFLKEQDY